MLTRSFIHLQGVGSTTEARLWQRGATDWDAFLRIRDGPGIARAALRRPAHRSLLYLATPGLLRWPDERRNGAGHLARQSHRGPQWLGRGSPLVRVSPGKWTLAGPAPGL